ncbi:ATP-binding protein [Teichococcus wenyumeiae]|uniref:ATP-binding protein n=1 Tax=Teichococcus wenyumeiae TaxID=2478470 RepID=UPI001F45C4CD|nr:ATP-binding protein [Pseudoroseomonas wenyumeiae]
MPEAAALLDAGGMVRAVNTPLQAALGPTQPVRPGWPAERIFAPALRAEMADWLAQPGAAPRESRLAAPQGMPEAPVAIRRITLPRGDSLLLLQDLTPRQAAAEADRLQTLGTLAGGIAHDFNNLLTVVLGASEDAQRLAGAADPVLAAELTQIRQAAGRGALLVKQLLAYARQQVLAPRLVPLNEAVEGIASLLRGSGQRQGVALEVALDEAGRMVLIDPSQLDRVVMNLAMNARQAMPQGGRLRLSTGRLVLLSPLPGVPDTVPPGRWTVLEVTDTGGGIPPEVLPRIFEPFFTTRPERGGTGLGLATVHGIVRQSGGFMVVESQPGQGACFRILLPRVDEPIADSLPAAPASAQPACHPAGPILLVDDEAPLRRLAERALRRAGHDVVVAEDAETALALLEEGLVPGHLVSDVAMPGMDGVALARAMRARLPRLPVLLVSGYAHAAVDGGLEEDGIRFLAKPYGPAELVAAVGEPVPAE